MAIPLFGFVIVLVGAGVCSIWLGWDGLAMAVNPATLVSLLSPIAFASAIVERGVEILISPWRDSGAAKLEKAVATIKASPANPATADADAAALKTATDALDEYRGETQLHAFSVSMALSVLVSLAGIRALGPFMDVKALAAAHSQQVAFLRFIDVGLTATLLAGGATGVHSVLNAVTSFFDATADKASKPAA